MEKKKLFNPLHSAHPPPQKKKKNTLTPHRTPTNKKQKTRKQSNRPQQRLWRSMSVKRFLARRRRWPRGFSFVMLWRSRSVFGFADIMDFRFLCQSRKDPVLLNLFLFVALCLFGNLLNFTFPFLLLFSFSLFHYFTLFFLFLSFFTLFFLSLSFFLL